MGNRLSFIFHQRRALESLCLGLILKLHNLFLLCHYCTYYLFQAEMTLLFPPPNAFLLGAVYMMSPVHAVCSYNGSLPCPEKHHAPVNALGQRRSRDGDFVDQVLLKGLLHTLGKMGNAAAPVQLPPS